MNTKKLPLAERVRPKNINQLIGQKHLLGQNKPLYNIYNEGILQSFILYGPPATGKSTFAKLYSEKLSIKTYYLNANILNKKELSDIIKNTEKDKSVLKKKEEDLFQLNNTFNNSHNKDKIILIIDEIHRISRPKQDTLLEPLEKGDILIIGTTTENPFFFLQPALRSRIFIYEFYDLSYEEIKEAILSSLERDIFFKNYAINFEEEALFSLINKVKDIRKILNIIEIIVNSKIKNKILDKSTENINISINDLYNFLELKNTKLINNYSLNDAISAYIKSMRGTDPDASIYYLSLMLENGEDPEFIARRLIIFASEDIGLAYPYALPIATSCLEAVKNIGMPEAAIILSHITILFSLLKKNNSTYKAYLNAKNFIQNGNFLNIPYYLRGGARKLFDKYLMKDINSENNKLNNTTLNENLQNDENIEEYLYPHDFPDHYIKQRYIEKEVKFYFPELIGFEVDLIKWYEYLQNKYNKKN
ncbi:MAG: AAA family ATPase [Spirochaetes bacterium]|nr:AAA family ATPase [Spirochaetota bacterium]